MIVSFILFSLYKRHIYACIYLYKYIYRYINIYAYLYTYISIYKVCPESIQPCNMKIRDIYWRRQIQDTRNIVHRTMMPQSPFVGTLGPYIVLPTVTSCPAIFSWISSIVWNLFPFKPDFSFGKSQKSLGAKSGP